MAIAIAPTIWEPDHLKSVCFCPDFKCLWQNGTNLSRYQMIVGLPDFRSQSKSRPFEPNLFLTIQNQASPDFRSLLYSNKHEQNRFQNLKIGFFRIIKSNLQSNNFGEFCIILYLSEICKSLHLAIQMGEIHFEICRSNYYKNLYDFPSIWIIENFWLSSYSNVVH